MNQNNTSGVNYRLLKASYCIFYCLDVRSLLPEHHANGVNVLRLADERRGDVVHPVHQTEVLEVIDVLRGEVVAVANRRWGGGGYRRSLNMRKLIYEGDYYSGCVKLRDYLSLADPCNALQRNGLKPSRHETYIQKQRTIIMSPDPTPNSSRLLAPTDLT